MYGKPSFYETKTAHAQTIIITQIGKKELCSIGANQGPEKSYNNTSIGSYRSWKKIVKSLDDDEKGNLC